MAHFSFAGWPSRPPLVDVSPPVGGTEPRRLRSIVQSSSAFDEPYFQIVEYVNHFF
jgi:hypothetical protein